MEIGELDVGEMGIVQILMSIISYPELLSIIKIFKLQNIKQSCANSGVFQYKSSYYTNSTKFAELYIPSDCMENGSQKHAITT